MVCSYEVFCKCVDCVFVFGEAFEVDRSFIGGGSGFGNIDYSFHVGFVGLSINSEIRSKCLRSVAQLDGSAVLAYPVM